MSEGKLKHDIIKELWGEQAVGVSSGGVPVYERVSSGQGWKVLDLDSKLLLPELAGVV